MSQDIIPDDIAEFILQKINSVAEIEALVLFCNNSEKGWSVEALAERLYISDKQATELLMQLCRDGILVATAHESPLYRYQPVSTELQRMAERVAEFYSKHIVPVSTLIHSKAKTRVQEFADAFKLRKDK